MTHAEFLAEEFIKHAPLDIKQVEGFEWKIRLFFRGDNWESGDYYTGLICKKVATFLVRMTGFINPEIPDEDLEFKEVMIGGSDPERSKKINEAFKEGWRFYTVTDDLINDFTCFKLARVRS